jgi:hypothetical protein
MEHSWGTRGKHTIRVVAQTPAGREGIDIDAFLTMHIE